MGWRVYDLPNAVIQLPTDDVLVHTLHENCPCDPEVTSVAYTSFPEGVPEGKLAIRKLIEHEAMDGREDADNR